MGYEKNYLILLLLIALLFLVLDVVLGFGWLDVDLGFFMPIVILLFGLIGAVIYARTGNWAFFFIAGVIIVAGVVNLLEITGGWTGSLVSAVIILAGIGMGVLRLMHKAAGH